MSHTTEIWLYMEQMGTEQHNKAVRKQTQSQWLHFKSIFIRVNPKAWEWTLIEALRIVDSMGLDRGGVNEIMKWFTQRISQRTKTETWVWAWKRDIGRERKEGKKKNQEMPKTSTLLYTLINCGECRFKICDWSGSEQNIKLIVRWPPADLLGGHEGWCLRGAWELFTG